MSDIKREILGNFGGLDPFPWKGLHLLHSPTILGNLDLGKGIFELFIGF